MAELIPKKQKLRICECEFHPVCEYEKKRFDELVSELNALKQILKQQKEQLEAISQLVLNHF